MDSTPLLPPGIDKNASIRIHTTDDPTPPPSRRRTSNTKNRTRLGSISFHTPRCLRLQLLLAVVSQQTLKCHHIATVLIQFGVLSIIALCSGQTHAALGLPEEYVILIVVLEIIQALMTLFVLAGVLVHINDRQWDTSGLAALWLITTLVFAALYMTIAISYDSLLCDGTQPCLKTPATPANVTGVSRSIHVRPVSMPQLSSNISFEYPDVWLKEYRQNVTEPTSMGNGPTTPTHVRRVFKQMRLERKTGVSGAVLIMLQFWYYSVQMQTQVGVGDVVPVCWLARSVAMVQMLVGILFSATLVSLTLDSFRQKRKVFKQEQRARLKRLTQLTASASRAASSRRSELNSAQTSSQSVVNDAADPMAEATGGGNGEVADLMTAAKIEAELLSRTAFSSPYGSSDEDEEENVEREQVARELGQLGRLSQLGHLDQLPVSNQSWTQKEEDLLALVLRQQEERNHTNKSPLNRTSRGVSMNSEDIHARNLLHPSDATRAGRNRGSGFNSSRLGQRPSVDGDNNYGTPSRAYSSAMFSSSHSSSRAATAFPHSGNSVGWGTWLCGRSLASRLRAFRRFMRRWLLLVTIVAQGLHLFWLYLVDDELFSGKTPHEHRIFHANTTIALISLFVQISMVLAVVATALVYVRHSERITLNYLCQAFLAICIHFSGIYVMIFLFQGKRSWPTVGVAEDNADGDSGGIAVRNEGFWGTSLRFIYVSIVLMTTTGCNTLSPKSEIAIIAVTTQMVISFLFLAVILALGVNLLNSERTKNRKSTPRSITSSSMF